MAGGGEKTAPKSGPSGTRTDPDAVGGETAAELGVLEGGCSDRAPQVSGTIGPLLSDRAEAVRRTKVPATGVPLTGDRVVGRSLPRET